MLSDEDSLTPRKYFVYIPNIAGLSIVYVCNCKKEHSQLQQRPPRHVCKDKKNTRYHKNALMKDNNETQSVYQRVFVKKGNRANSNQILKAILSQTLKSRIYRNQRRCNATPI